MEEGMEIVDRINWSDIGLLGDFYNLEKAEEADEDMGRYMQRLLHVHISDDEGSPWRRSYLKEEKAQIHQRRLGRLYENGYAGAVSLEIDVPAKLGAAEESLRIMKGKGGV